MTIRRRAGLSAPWVEMAQRGHQALCAAVVAWVAASGQAVAVTAGEAEALLERAGSNAVLVEWEHLAEPSGVVLERLEPADAEWLAGAVGEAFDADRARSVVVDSLVAGWDARSASAMDAWLGTELGARVSAMERSAARDEAVMERYAQTIRRLPPTEERLRLVERWDAATRSTENASRIGLTVGRASLLAMNDHLPEAQRISRAELDSRIERLGPRIVEETRRRVIFVALYTYRALPLAELEAHVEQLESPAGEWLYGTVAWGVERALREAVERFSTWSSAGSARPLGAILRSDDLHPGGSR